MTNINPNANPLQSQIQAQLQAGRQSNRNDTARLSNTVRQPNPAIEEQDEAFDAPSVAADRRNRLLARNARSNNDISSTDELEEAEERIAVFNNNLREAPVGRLSTQQSNTRDVPLGQVVDIRV
jgi:transcription elongation GreA/GreB family factor